MIGKGNINAMDRYTYTLKQDTTKKENRLYSRTELELMTAFQLRDICWRERIINGIQAAMDKDELIRQIMRFRGRTDHLFITADRNSASKQPDPYKPGDFKGMCEDRCL